MSPRQFVGRLLIALVVVNAVAGVTALLVSSDKQIGTYEARILATTVIASAAVIAALPCLVVWERRGLVSTQGFPVLTIGVLILAAAWLIGLVWTDSPGDDLVSVGFSLGFIAFGLALINLLSLAELPPSQRWLILLANALAALFAGQGINLVWSEEPNDDPARFLVATAILLAAVGSLVLILQRLQAARPEEAPSYCPRCGTRLEDMVFGTPCADCGAIFRIEFS